MLYFLKDLLKQDTLVKVVWVPIDIWVSQSKLYLCNILSTWKFCLYPVIKKQTKRKPLGKFIFSYRVWRQIALTSAFTSRKSPYISWVVNKFYSRQMVQHIHKQYIAIQGSLLLPIKSIMKQYMMYFLQIEKLHKNHRIFLSTYW